VTILDSIKAMPTIADANGQPCVSQAAVLALIESKAVEWRARVALLDEVEQKALDLGFEKTADMIGCISFELTERAAELAGERLSAERGPK